MNNRQIIDNNINMLMSSYFKCKRLECGLTGKQMGQLLCKSQQHISRYELNQSSIPLDEMVFFLKTYNFNLNDFFDYILAGISLSEAESNTDNHHCAQKKQAG